MFGERRARVLLFGAVAAFALAGCGGGGGGGGGEEVVVVTFASQAGWLGGGEHCAGGVPTGDQGFLVGPGTPPRGAGSYGLVVGSDPESFEAIGHPRLDGTRVADVTALSYGTYVANPGGGAAGVLAPYITLFVDTTGDNIGDDALLFMPGLSGTVAVGAWQTWNALSGVWCDSTGCGTRAEYLALHPNARIVNDGAIPGFLIAVGCGAGLLDWANFEAAVDAVRIGVGGRTTLYDFEP